MGGLVGAGGTRAVRIPSAPILLASIHWHGPTPLQRKQGRVTAPGAQKENTDTPELLQNLPVLTAPGFSY